jgi:hypothetical protein
MEVLEEFGRQTRHNLVRAARHTGGLLVCIHYSHTHTQMYRRERERERARARARARDRASAIVEESESMNRHTQ